MVSLKILLVLSNFQLKETFYGLFKHIQIADITTLVLLLSKISVKYKHYDTTTEDLVIKMAPKWRSMSSMYNMDKLDKRMIPIWGGTQQDGSKLNHAI